MEAVNEFGFLAYTDKKPTNYIIPTEEGELALRSAYGDYQLDNALSLYNMGFSIFPIPYAQKGSSASWRLLQSVRLPEPGTEALGCRDIFAEVFKDRFNIGIVAGKVSDNLLFIDCEDRATFREVETGLIERGLEIYAVKSGGSAGGGHFYFRLKEGEGANKPKSQTTGNFEIWCHSHYVLAAGSVHPETGALYDLHENNSTEEVPVVSVSDLEWLGVQLRHNEQPEYMKLVKAVEEKIEVPLYGLNKSTLEFILNGANVGSRNNSLFSAACDFAAYGLEIEDAEHFLGNAAEECGLEDDEIGLILDSAYSKPREGNAGVTLDYMKAIHWINTNPELFSGRSGASRREVALALCERSKLDQDTDGWFRASTRELSELSRVGLATVSRVIKYLVEIGFVVKRYSSKENYDPYDASRYAFNRKITKNNNKLEDNNGTVPTTGLGYCSINGLSSHDLLERRALSKNGYRLFEMLVTQTEPLMPKAISEITPFSHRQVKYELEKLLEAGLVKRVEEGYIAVPLVSNQRDNLAAEYGVLGAGDRRKERYQKERSIEAARRIMLSRRLNGW